MVTQKEYYKDGFYYSATKLFGLSTDSKPTSFGNGSLFVEIDTGKTYLFDANSKEWHEQDTKYIYLSGDITESPQKIGELPDGDWVCSVLYPLNLDITAAPNDSNEVIVTSENYTGAVVVLCFGV